MKTIIIAITLAIISHVYALDLTEAVIKPEYKGNKPYKRSYFKHWVDVDVTVTLNTVDYTFTDISFDTNGNVIQGQVGDVWIRFYSDGTIAGTTGWDHLWTGERP